MINYLKTQLASAGLATFAGQPAIWENVAPSDEDTQWGETGQYPRITYYVDRTSSLSQILMGTLHVWIWALDSLTDPLNTVQAALVAALDGAALSTSEGPVMFWVQTVQPYKSFDNPHALGLELTFAFQAFIPQTTFTPDPVAALNRWASTYLDTHLQVAPAAWAPATDTNAALYVRSTSRQTLQADKTFWGYWVTERFELHVLAPDFYARSNWVRLIADALKIPAYRRIRLDDNSPLLIGTVTENRTANPYRTGQISVEARYGVLASEGHTSFTTPPGNGGDGGEGTWPTPPITPPGGGGGGPWPVTLPVYVSNIDTGQPLGHIWWSLKIPQDGTETPPSEITPPGPIEGLNA